MQRNLRQERKSFMKVEISSHRLFDFENCSAPATSVLHSTRSSPVVRFHFSYIETCGWNIKINKWHIYYPTWNIYLVKWHIYCPTWYIKLYLSWKWHKKARDRHINSPIAQKLEGEITWARRTPGFLTSKHAIGT